MSCNIVSTINGNECIGDSRDKINSNFAALESVVCSLSTNSIIANDTDTIDLTFTPSTRILVGGVKPDSLDSTHLKDNSVGTSELSAQAVTTAKIAPEAVRYSQLASWQSLSASPTLSAEAVTQRLPRAWGSFTKTGALTGSSFNVASVIDTSTSQKAVNFITEMPSNLYTVILGIGSETAAMQSFDPFSLFPRTRSGFNIYNTDELQTWTTITFVVYDA